MFSVCDLVVVLGLIAQKLRVWDLLVGFVGSVGLGRLGFKVRVYGMHGFRLQDYKVFMCLC